MKISSQPPSIRLATKSGQPNTDTDLHTLAMDVDNENSGMKPDRLQGSSANLEDAASPTSTNTYDGLDVGKDIKSLMDLVQRLRLLGIENITLPLPKIVVVGDQSTGKSSVIEGISGISVPRSAGTCTRCPLEVNLRQHNSPWACEVLLTKQYIFVPGHRNASATKRNPFGPWQPMKDVETHHFASLSSKEDVTRVLKRAQSATLNPSLSPLQFASGEMDYAVGDKSEAEFSPNIVTLNISGPELPNLAFYDLPGVISQVEHKETYLIDLVRNLVKEYIHAKNCLILQTLTMNNDAANSVAAGIIREAGADTRTTGVLTKPDLLNDQDVQFWADVLSGKRFPLSHGYYIVKNNPNPSVDQITARMEEEAFFEDFDASLMKHRNRFGTVRLQNALSNSLGELITAGLPDIQRRVHQRIKLVEEELLSLPKAPEGNVTFEIQERTASFSRHIGEQIKGGSISRPFFKNWLAKVQTLKEAISKCQPMLELSTKYKGKGQDPVTPPELMSSTQKLFEHIDLTFDDEDVITPTPTPGKRKRGGEVAMTPKRIKCDPEDVGTQSSRVELTLKPKKYNLQQIQDLIKSFDTGMNSVHPAVLHQMAHDCLETWQQHVQHFVEETCKFISSTVQTKLEESFGCWSTTQLATVIGSAADDFLAGIFERQRKLGETFVRMEQMRPMTFDNEGFQLEKEKFLKALLSRRTHNRALGKVSKEEQDKIMTDSAREKRMRDIKADPSKELGPDPYALEIVEMASVQAYYSLAANRLVHNIAKSFNSELFIPCSNDLENHLIEKLGLRREDANERCKELLEVSPEVMERRKMLESERKKLVEGRVELENFSPVASRAPE